MNLKEIIRKVRELDPNQHIQLVVLTGEDTVHEILEWQKPQNTYQKLLAQHILSIYKDTVSQMKREFISHPEWWSSQRIKYELNIVNGE